MSETQQTGGSFLPSKQQKVLALDDVDVLVIQARIVPWDYGKGGEKGINTFVRLTLAVDGNTDPKLEYYSLGKDTVVAPSLDGKTPLPTRGPDGKVLANEGYYFVGAKKPLEGVPEGSVAGLLMADLVNAGFNEADMSNDIRFMEGVKFHAVQKKGKTQGGDDKNHLLPSKYLGKGSVPAGIAVPAAASSPAAPGAPAGNGAVALARIQELITNAIVAKGGPITKGEAVAFVSSNASAEEKNGLIALLLQEATLKAGPYKYDGTSLSF